MHVRPVLIGLCFLLGAMSCSSALEVLDPTPPVQAGARATSIVAVTPVAVAGTVGAPVSPAPTVRVTDKNGMPVAGVQVVFVITGDNGTVTAKNVPTDPQGRASIDWTLGINAASGNTLTATVATLAPVIFTASAVVGPIALIVPSGGDSQRGLPGSALPTPLSVRVTDSYSNPIPGATVTFTVESGGGSLQGSTAVTDASGSATSGEWTLGPALGEQRVRAVSATAVRAFIATGVACRAQLVGEPCDGSARLLFTRVSETKSFNDLQIYRVALDGSDLIRLTNEGRNLRPVSAPDGRIAFVRANDNSGDIYLMDPDGSHVIRRTTSGNFWSAEWSPDGRSLLVSDEGVYASNVYLISATDDGKPPVLVARDARSPSWSPDGKRISFVRVSGDDGYDETWMMNADGTGAHALTNTGGGRSRPSWSPDGKRLAFSVCMAASCDIFVMNADGSNTRRVTSVGSAQEARWSSDGEWLAVSLWVYFGASVDVTLAYVPSDGGVPRAILKNGFHPSWRPSK